MGNKTSPRPKTIFWKKYPPKKTGFQFFSGQMNFEIFRKTKKIGIPGKKYNIPGFPTSTRNGDKPLQSPIYFEPFFQQ